jgi:DNA-binding transcriptional ArsR family regulator
MDALSTTFAALADPTRRAILARLATGDCSVTELAAPFEMSLPAVSKHLRVLERAGLIARGREAQWRPCRLEAAPLKDVADWAASYRHLWEQRLDRLDTYLHQLQGRTPAPRPSPTPARSAKDPIRSGKDPLGSEKDPLRSEKETTPHARHPRRRH